MRVRVTYSTEVGDFYRRAIRNHYGQDGLATRAEVVTWLRRHGDSADDDIIHDLQQAIERGEVADVPPTPRTERTDR